MEPKLHTFLLNRQFIVFFWFNLQTAVISYDYLTSLRSVPYGSEEYDSLKSQVGDTLNCVPQKLHKAKVCC